MLTTPDDVNSVVDADVDEPAELAITKDTEQLGFALFVALHSYNKTDSSMRILFDSYVVFVHSVITSYMHTIANHV